MRRRLCFWGMLLRISVFRPRPRRCLSRAAACPGADVSASLSRATALYVEAGDDDRAQLIGIKLLDAMPGDACLAYHLALSFRRTGDTGLSICLSRALPRAARPII